MPQRIMARINFMTTGKISNETKELTKEITDLTRELKDKGRDIVALEKKYISSNSSEKKVSKLVNLR